VKIWILGCGTSSGVPRIGNDWGDCDPNEPRNARTRASILVEADNGEGGAVRVLVDTSPDMRTQLLRCGIGSFDAVIWTHDHADHCHGIDDLRQIYHSRGRPVDGYARQSTLSCLQQRFAYAFEGRGGYPATVNAKLLPDRLVIGDLTITVADQPHGNITSAGLRFDHRGRSAGYSTDISGMTGDVERNFSNLDLWIVDALREREHPTHSHLGLTLSWVEQLRPARTLLTHMDQSMDYASLMERLPAGIEPAYDNLMVEV